MPQSGFENDLLSAIRQSQRLTALLKRIAVEEGLMDDEDADDETEA